MSPQATPVAMRQTCILPSSQELNITPSIMVYPRISRFRLIRRICLPPDICTIQIPRTCRLINWILPSRSKLLAISCTSVAQYGCLGCTSTSRRRTWRPTWVLYYPLPPYGYQWPVYSGYYPPQPLPVGHPPSASTAPAAQDKHGGNGGFLVDKGKAEIT